MNLINYLNEKNLIQKSIVAPYSFEIIEQIAFAVVDLIFELNYKHLKEGGNFLVKYKFLSPLSYDIYIQFMELNLESINENDFKHKNDYDNVQQLLKSKEFSKIENGCKEYLLFDHRDTWSWSYYAAAADNNKNYNVAAKATELVFIIDECMASIPNIIKFYFLAGDYKRLLLAHEVFEAQYGESYKKAFNYSEAES